MWMLDGKRCEEWDHTAMLLATISNLARSKKQKAMKPMDFHPYRTAKRADIKPVSADEWSAMGKSLVKSGQFVSKKKENG
jgi:hypothetical protein